MAAKPVKVAFLADTADLKKSLASAQAAMQDTGDTAKAAGSKIDTAFESTAGHADDVASKGAQAAGALSGLGDLVGGSFGTAMATGGIAMQAFADAGDLVNVVTESAIVKKVKDAAVTTVQTARNLAAAAAQRVVAGATQVWAVAQRVLNAAMRANPIGLVITALVLLGGGLVLAYKKSETFRNIVNAAFGAVKSAANALWSGLKGVFSKLTWAFTHLVPLGIVIANFDKIVSTVRTAVGKIWGFISGLPGKIAGAFSGIWSGIAGGLKSAINAVLHLPLTIPKINTHIPGVGTVGGQTLIPALANGGIVNRATLALIGEAGPEAVVPLGRGGFGNVYRIEVNVPPTANLSDVGREVVRAIEAFEGSGGRRRAS